MNHTYEFLIEHNRKQSDLFLSSNEFARRNQFILDHPTKLMGLFCMDGRINFSAYTDGYVPLGIMSDYRNMGGKFNIGAQNFAPYVLNFGTYVETEVAALRSPGGLVFVTYHFSKGNVGFGCKGFGYDTESAKAYTRALKENFERAFGSDHILIHPIQIGIETDTGSFLFHGDDPSETPFHVWDKNLYLDITAIRYELRRLYPNMKPSILEDLILCVQGNQSYVLKQAHSGDEIVGIDHEESIVVVGRGLDWFHIPNRMLIVGPFSTDWKAEVRVAMGILNSNVQEGRINIENGVVLHTSYPYRRPGPDREISKMRVEELDREVRILANEEIPHLLEHTAFLSSVLDLNTMRLHPLVVK